MTLSPAGRKASTVDMFNDHCGVHSAIPQLLTTYLALRRQASRGVTNGSDTARFYCHEESAENAQVQFDETLLQIVWNEQRLRDNLFTADGQRLSVVSPGLWNVEAGPDFKDAVLRINGEEICGHVEIHRSVRDWHRHGHHQDPAFDDVILHVVYHRPSDENTAADLPPCLVLQDTMDRSLSGTHAALQRAEVYAGRIAPGFCAARWALTEDEAVRQILQAAGLARFADKAQAYTETVRRLGPDQAFYEGFFDALGYKGNRQPFQQLAQAVLVADLQQLPGAQDRIAALFGTAGFLPDLSIPQALSEEESAEARSLWHAWWIQGRAPAAITWHRGATRPANRPEKRLAAGCTVLERLNYKPTDSIDRIAAGENDPERLIQRLRDIFSVTKNTPTRTRTIPSTTGTAGAVLGTDRVNDMLVNVVLPWLKARAQQRNEQSTQDLIEQSFLTLPRLQPNRPLKEAKHRLFVPPSRCDVVVRGACEQQGMLDIYKRFCCPLNHACRDCNLFQEPVAGSTTR